jgi:hypothetical protein
MIATPLVNRVVVALLGAIGLSGCCAGHSGNRGGRGGGECFAAYVPACFGYSSTCWHAWPGECITCPTHTFPPQSAEPLPGAPLPAQTEGLSPADAIPPVPDATPVPEPSPSDQAPAPEKKQSRRELPPPVLVDPPLPAVAVAPLDPPIDQADGQPLPVLLDPPLPATASVPVVTDPLATPKQAHSEWLPPVFNESPSPAMASTTSATSERPVRRRPLPALFLEPQATPATATHSEPPSGVTEFPPALSLAPPAKSAENSQFEPPPVLTESPAPAVKTAPFVTPQQARHEPPPPVLTESPAPEVTTASFAQPPRPARRGTPDAIRNSLPFSIRPVATRSKPVAYEPPPPVLTEAPPQVATTPITAAQPAPALYEPPPPVLIDAPPAEPTLAPIVTPETYLRRAPRVRTGE